MQVAHTVADQNFDGAPDLFLYGSKGLVIWFVEVKSASDTLKAAQLAVVSFFAVGQVKCQICCPECQK